jgi:DnaK suppressor protein
MPRLVTPQELLTIKQANKRAQKISKIIEAHGIQPTDPNYQNYLKIVKKVIVLGMSRGYLRIEEFSNLVPGENLSEDALGRIVSLYASMGISIEAYQDHTFPLMSLKNCSLAFHCDEDWNSMQSVSVNPSVRICHVCKSEVHLCESIADLAKATSMNVCVAIRESIEVSGNVRALGQPYMPVQIPNADSTKSHNLKIKQNSSLSEVWKNKPLEKLSDDEIAAMPDSEYMNYTQMAFFRHKLCILQRQILNNVEETSKNQPKSAALKKNPADMSQSNEANFVETSIRDRELNLLKRVDSAIARIDAGVYGYCDETGEPIGIDRLLARPTANLSVDAQKRHDLSGSTGQV